MKAIQKWEMVIENLEQMNLTNIKVYCDLTMCSFAYFCKMVEEFRLNFIFHYSVIVNTNSNRLKENKGQKGT